MDDELGIPEGEIEEFLEYLARRGRGSYTARGDPVARSTTLDPFGVLAPSGHRPAPNAST